jgi:hypothetical protein
VWGESDDLIEFGGDYVDEFGAYRAGSHPLYVHFPEGTVLRVRYGPDDQPNAPGWVIEVAKQGTATVTITKATNPDNDYSDKATVVGEFHPAQTCIWGSLVVGADEYASAIIDKFDSGSIDRYALRKLPLERLREMHAVLAEVARG